MVRKTTVTFRKERFDMPLFASDLEGIPEDELRQLLAKVVTEADENTT